jgi:asparagine synthase (glutamine-hydrolysing)
MCGIVGVWEYGSGEGRVDLPLVERMRDTMVHRGPDDSGVQAFDGGRGVFGFRRLSIIDLTAAVHQPMTGCSDRKIEFVFKGEIYYHAALR